MSDLQDLIHKTSMDCLAKGRQQEQERIIKLAKQWQEDLVTGNPYTTEELAEHRDNGYKDGFEYLIALIRESK